jgi:hypothetical protein
MHTVSSFLSAHELESVSHCEIRTLLAAIKRNSRTRSFWHVDERRLSGARVLPVPGLQKRINTTAQFLDHLANERCQR